LKKVIIFQAFVSFVALARIMIIREGHIMANTPLYWKWSLVELFTQIGPSGDLCFFDVNSGH